MSTKKTGRKDQRAPAGPAGGGDKPTAAPTAGANPGASATTGVAIKVPWLEIELKVSRRDLLRVLGLALLLLAVAAGAGYFILLRPPMDSARAALRIACYDTALTRLKTVPGWLDWWPGVTALRDKAQLGNDLNTPPQNWRDLGLQLRELRARAPADADLMVMDAALTIHDHGVSGVADTLGAAVRADPANAEAWSLLGLVRDLTGEDATALVAYRQAADLAPQSPQYRSNLARALLDRGDPGAALEEYRDIGQFPLARVEQALAHWARGEPGAAAEAQGAAIDMLDNKTLMESPPNRLDWRFELKNEPPPDNGVRLAHPSAKRCYALLGQAVSRRLTDKPGGAWSVPQCGKSPAETPSPRIQQLVADDLCRFVDPYQPALKATAATLRRALGQPATCAQAPRSDGRPR